MPKQNNYYLRQLSGRGEEYTREDYEELLRHEGQFRYSDFKSWNMAKLLRTSRVLRDEAFRRAQEFEDAMKNRNIPLSPAYSRLEERNVTWVKNRNRLKFGSKKIEVINNIIQTLTFLDDETSTVSGWTEVLSRLSKQTKVPVERLMDRDKSQAFFELYYKVTHYLTEHGVNWKPSETMQQVNYVTKSSYFKNLDWEDEDVIRSIERIVRRRLTRGYQQQRQKELQKTDISVFLTTKK